MPIVLQERFDVREEVYSDFIHRYHRRIIELLNQFHDGLGVVGPSKLTNDTRWSTIELTNNIGRSIEIVTSLESLWLYGYRRSSDGDNISPWKLVSEYTRNGNFSSLPGQHESLGFEGKYTTSTSTQNVSSPSLNNAITVLDNYSHRPANSDKARNAFLVIVLYFAEALRILPVRDLLCNNFAQHKSVEVGTFNMKLAKNWHIISSAFLDGSCSYLAGEYQIHNANDLKENLWLVYNKRTKVHDLDGVRDSMPGDPENRDETGPRDSGMGGYSGDGGPKCSGGKGGSKNEGGQPRDGVASSRSRRPRVGRGRSGTSSCSGQYSRRASGSSMDSTNLDKVKTPPPASGSIDTPGSSSSLRAVVSGYAKSYKEKCFRGDSDSSDVGVTDDLRLLWTLCTKLNACENSRAKGKGKLKVSAVGSFDISAGVEEQLNEVVSEMLTELSKGDGVSTFEFIGSGAVIALLNYLSCGTFGKKKIPDNTYHKLRQKVIRQYKSFISIAFCFDKDGSGTPMMTLVQKLQNALSSLEQFPVMLSQSGRSSSSGRARLSSGLSALSQPFKLHLCQAQREKSLHGYSSNVVLIDPLESLAAVADFLWPRIQCTESSSTQKPSTNSESGSASAGPVATASSGSGLVARCSTRYTRSSVKIGGGTSGKDSQEASGSANTSSSKGKGKAVLKPSSVEPKGLQTINAARRKATSEKDTEMKPAHDNSSSEEDDELDASPVEINDALMIGEVGTGLGPTLEFYTLLSHDLQKASLGLWRSSSNFEDSSVMETDLGSDGKKLGVDLTGRSNDLVRALLGLFPCPWSVNADMSEGSQLYKVMEYFRFTGRVMAKALQDGRLLDLPLSTAFYKLVLGQELDLHDILSFDTEFGKILQELQILVHRKKYLGLCGDSTQAIDDLRFRGAPIEDLCLDFTLPGYPGYVLKEGEESTSLLEVMAEFSPEQQHAFCQFVTGAPRLPPGGLVALSPKLTIVRKHLSNVTSTPTGTGATEFADEDFPSVMTCANYLELPPYSTKEVMYKKLLYAIDEGQGSFDLS